MLTVGIAHDIFISSAAVVRDGTVVAAIPEERLNRRKQWKGFPQHALNECLRQAGARFDDVDVVAVGWNPARHLGNANSRQSGTARWRPEYLYAIPNWLMSSQRIAPGTWIDQGMDGQRARIVHVDHHLAHAANAFFLSPWERAAVVSVDGRGEHDTVWWGVAARDPGEGRFRLERRGGLLFPHSLGLLYGTVTQYLGFRPDSDEWKVMALASFGSPDNEHYRRLRPLVTVDAGTGRFFVDQRYFVYHEPEVHAGRFYTEDFVDLFGPARGTDDPITERHHDIAWALQRVFEDTMTAVLSAVHRATGEERVVAAGGCLMNSVYNGRITRSTPFREAFVSSCPDDSGISVGAALWAYHQFAPSPGRGGPHPHNYWGPSYSSDEVESTVRGYKLRHQRVSDAAATAARLLAEGSIVGWFQGAMEFGQRALGNRSILLDPRRADGKDVVNRAVKYREAFRPFAPAILAERVHEWFYAEPDGRVPFMEKVYEFRPEVRDRVPAVVHADGTGRLQTVEREHNPRFYDLIAAFDRLTGVPLVLNTSFNLNGEPIVASPTDAIRTFASCGLDALILEDVLLTK
jgi:carbamoyltransferase